MSKPKKPKNKREAVRYPALERGYNLKSRQDYLETDYVHKLSDKDKEWLNAFLEESVNANFKHRGPILHDTPALKKACYDANNARNRDIFNKAKITGNLDYFSNGATLEKIKVKKKAPDGEGDANGED